MVGSNAKHEHTIVVDDNIGDYTKPQLFFRLASAYADSSHQIVRSMLAGDLPKTFAHAQAMHFLFEHAVELFLKGAIRRMEKSVQNTHDLKTLHDKYRKHYRKKIFKFTIRIAELVKATARSPHSVFPRYPVDTKGKVWEGYNAYTLETWLTETKNLRQDLERLIPQIDPLPPPAL